MYKNRRSLSFFILVILISCGPEEGPIEELSDTIKFVTTIGTSVDHNRMYSYTFNAISSHSEIINFTIDSIPEWMEYDTISNTISGIPGWGSKEKSFKISINASDGNSTINQSAIIVITFANILCNQDFGDPSESEYILPFNAGVSSEIMQSYCNSSNSHNNTFAYDFLLEIGEDIIASRSGIAVQIQEGFPDASGISGQENFVYVQHDDGSVIRYVHLMHNSIPIEEGDRVEQGQVLGKNGLSGGTPRPHLHFELFREFTWNDKRFALPVNFKNANGKLDRNKGLISGNTYTAE